MNGLLLGALLWAAAGRDYDREIAGQRRELDAIRGRLVEEQRELSALKQRKSATLEELERLSGSIALGRQYLEKLEDMEKHLAASVDATQSELRLIEGRLDIRGRVMAKRVRLLFVAGRPEFLLLGDQGDFFRRAYLVKRMVRYDHSLVEENRKDMGLKRRSLQQLLARREQLESFRGRKREEMQRFTHAQTDQEQTLRTLQKSESVKAAALRQLEENTRLLTEIIITLEKRRKEEQARSRRKALVLETGERYCAPVVGPVVSRYGLQYHATLGTSTRNLGLEIEAKDGATVRAAVSGEVAMITRIPGYGLGVILDNGSGYFTLYANLSGIRVGIGDKVKTCQEIASAAAQPGKVYFEVRQGTRTLDPEAWLKGGEK